MLDSDRLEVFVAVADTGGFSAAARSLGRSQPAVHAQVRTLQDELGVRLYRRAGRGIVLTAAGEQVAAHGRELASRTGHLLAQLQGDPDQPLRLATGAGACRHLLTPALRAAAAEGLLLTPMLCDAEAALQAAEEGRAALAVTAAAPRASLEDAVLRVVHLTVHLPCSHPGAGAATLPLAALDGQPVILPPEGRPLRRRLDAALDEAGVSVQRPVSVRDWSLAAHLGAVGLGWPVVADFVPPGAARVAVRLEPSFPATYRLFWRRGALHGPALRLAELIRTRC
jgi:DNA-binding transcriptional LysR family regulator